MRYAIIDTDGEILSVDAMPHKERISKEVEDDFVLTYKKFDEKSKKFVEKVDQCRTDAHKKVNEWYNEKKSNGIKGGIYSKTLKKQIDCKLDSITTAGQIVQTGAIKPEAIPNFYKAYDNSVVDCSYEQWCDVYVELHTAGQAIWEKQHNSKLQIQAAKTVKEIEEILAGL